MEYEGQQIGCAHPIEWYEGEGAWQVKAVPLCSLDRSPPQEAPQGGSLQGSSQVHDSSHAVRPHRPPRGREHASSDVPRRPKRRHRSGHVRRPGLKNPPNPRKAAEARWPWHRGGQRRGQQASVFARPPGQPPQEQPHHRDHAPRPAVPLPSVPSPRFLNPRFDEEPRESASSTCQSGSFDRILCDVPCSGDGTLVRASDWPADS